MKIENCKLQINRGFTLIELLLVVIIVLTLGAMSAVFYSRFLTQNNVATIQDKFLGSLRKAQMYSMMSRKSNTLPWGVHYESNQITLFQGTSYGTRTTALDEKFTVANSIIISGVTDVIFARTTGIPSASGTITITGPNSTSKTITLNSQGVASR